MKKRIAIYGAGGLGREIFSWVNQLSGWTVVGFVDDNVNVNTIISGVTVVGGIEWINAQDESLAVVLAIGNPQLKSALANRITNEKIYHPTLVHPSAIILNTATVTLGQGVLVSAGVVLTTDIRIGKHTLLNLNCTVGHDAVVGDYSSVMPGVNIAGNVIVGEQVLLGAGSNIMNGKHIGDNCKVGMGAVVIHDVSNGKTVVGVPAKPVNP